MLRLCLVSLLLSSLLVLMLYLLRPAALNPQKFKRLIKAHAEFTVLLGLSLLVRLLYFVPKELVNHLHGIEWYVNSVNLHDITVGVDNKTGLMVFYHILHSIKALSVGGVFVINIILSLTAGLLLYRLMIVLYRNKWPALLVSSVFLLYPMNILLSSSFAETFFVVTLELLLFLVLLKNNKSWFDIGAAISIYSLLLYTRIDTVFAMGLFTIYAILDKKVNLRQTATLLASFAIVSIPHAIMLYMGMGGNSANSCYTFSSLIESLSSRHHNLFFMPEYSSLFLLLFAAVGFLYLVSIKDWKNLLLLLSWSFLLNLFLDFPSIYFCFFCRISIYYITPLLILAGLGLYFSFHMACAININRRALYAVLLAAILFSNINTPALEFEEGLNTEKQFRFIIENIPERRHCSLAFPHLKNLSSLTFSDREIIHQYQTIVPKFVSILYHGRKYFTATGDGLFVTFASEQPNCTIFFYPLHCNLIGNYCGAFKDHLGKAISREEYKNSPSDDKGEEYLDTITIGFFEWGSEKPKRLQPAPER